MPFGKSVGGTGFEIFFGRMLNYSRFLANALPPLRVEVSLAFYNQSDAEFYDPGAPSVAQRMTAIKILRQNAIPVVLRIDPLLSHNLLPGSKFLSDFQLPAAQSLSDMEKLVRFAAENGVLHIVYSVAKIVAQDTNQSRKQCSNSNTFMNIYPGPKKLFFTAAHGNCRRQSLRNILLNHF